MEPTLHEAIAHTLNKIYLLRRNHDLPAALADRVEAALRELSEMVEWCDHVDRLEDKETLIRARAFRTSEGRDNIDHGTWRAGYITRRLEVLAAEADSDT